MDEASKLVSELQSKLAELDQRVGQYRRDMTSEFDKYAEQLLRDVPRDVSETVSKCLAESMKGYTSLYPDGRGPFESCATGTGTGTGIHQLSNDDGSPSQPHVTSASMSFLRPAAREDDIPRSPHARDKEFRGVFTPEYLPLLDSHNRNERRTSSETLTSPPPGRISPQPRPMESIQIDASTNTRSLDTSPQVTRPPTPRRRNTDEVSVGSDWSEGGQTRRSALRRSSSTSRQSPRRVRFEVAGEEVLPTASPRTSTSVMTEDLPRSLADVLGEEEMELGSEQIEDIDEPPPKRISSSQALRALSRSPLVDDGTTWTAVTAPPDGSASVATTNANILHEEVEELEDDEDLFMGNGRPHFGLNGPLGSGGQKQNGEDDFGGNDMGESDDDSDDDLLNMPPLRRQAPSPASMHSPIKALSPAHLDISNNKSPTSSTRPSRAWKELENLSNQAAAMKNDEMKFNPGSADADDDDMFTFDEAGERKKSPQVGPEDEEYDDFDTDAPVSPISKEPMSKYSSSPAREIPRSSAANPPTLKDIVGSFRGHPFSLPLANPDLHAQAASLGDINTFVGSVDGRTGLDESDTKSYRMTSGIGSFSGAPRSMTERMFFDDLKPEADRKEKGKQEAGVAAKENEKSEAKEADKAKVKDGDKSKAKEADKPKVKDAEKSTKKNSKSEKK